MSKIQLGRQAATVTACSIGESTNKGTPGVFLTFKNDSNETIDSALWLSEKAFERTVKVLRDVFDFDDNFDTIDGQVIDKRCSITVEEEVDDKGKAWPRVKWINPEKHAHKPAADDFLKQLSAKAARIARATTSDEFPS